MKGLLFTLGALLFTFNTLFAQINGTTNICAGQTESYTISNSAASYLWTVTGARNYTPNGSEVTVEWGNTGTGNVSVESFDATNTSIGTSTVNITINGQPNAFFSSSFSTNTCPNLPRDSFPDDCFIACLSTPVIYSAPINAGITYTWQLIGDGTFTTLSNNEIEVTWTSLGLHTLRLSASNGSGCASVFEKCIEVIAAPTALIGSSISDVQVLTVCKNAPIFLEDKSTEATGRRWDFGDGNSSGKINPSHSYDQAGTYQVILTANNACFCLDTDTLTVIVEDTKAPEITCPAVVCGSDTVSYSTSAACSGFLWTAINGTIVGSNTSNTVDVVWNNHVGYIQLEAANCNNVCSAPATERIEVLVDNIPIQGSNPACQGEEVEYFIHPVPGSVYAWSIPNNWTLIEDNDYRVKVRVNGSGTIGVNYTNSIIGCSGSSSLSVSVRDVLAFALPEIFCSNDIITYNFAFPIDWTVFDTSGQIVFSDSSKTNVEMNYANLTSGNYTLQVGKRTSYCNDLQFPFEVLPAPTVPDTIYGNNNICEANAYLYSVDPRSGYRVEWTVIGGMPEFATGTDLTVNWNTGVSTYEIRAAYRQLENPNCLSDYTVKTIGTNSTTNPMIVATDSACSGDTATFGLNFVADQVRWRVLTQNGASILTDRFQNEITVQFSPSSSQIITIQAEGELCGTPFTYNHNTYVQTFPSPTITFSNPNPCPNELVTFTTNATNPIWEIDGVTYTSSSPALSFDSARSVLATVRAGYSGGNGCMVERVNIDQLIVKNAPKAFITAFDTNKSHCPDTLFPIKLQASLQGQNSLTYLHTWVKDGNIISVGSPFYTTQPTNAHGVYTVAIQAPNNCHSISEPFRIDTCSSSPNCTDIAFAPTPITVQIVLGNTSCSEYFVDSVKVTGGATLVDLESRNPNIPSHNAGAYGLGFTLAAGTHSLHFSGEVELNGSTYCFREVVNQTNDVAVDFIAVKQPCSASGLDRYELINTSTYANTLPGFSWNFGGGIEVTPVGSSGFNRIVEFPAGTYTVTLNSTGVVCSVSKQVTANTPVNAVFSSTAPACQEEVVEFTNQSSGNIIEYKWDLGGQVLFEENTSASFIGSNNNNTGILFPKIFLFVLDQNGCRDTIDQDIRIEGNQFNGVIAASGGLTTICEGSSIPIAFSQNGFNNTPINYQWSNQENTPSIQANQTGNYRLSITDNVGCRYVTNAVNIQVNDAPDPLIIGKSIFCADEPVKLSTLAHYSQTIAWNRNGNFTGINGENYEEILLSGVYQININATNTNNNCTAINAPHTVTVLNSVSTPSIMASGGSLCEGTPISLTASPSSGTFYWNTGQTGNSITQSLAGRYTVYQTDANGCQASNFIDIHPLPDEENFMTGCYCLPAINTPNLVGIPNMATYQWIKNGVNIPSPLGIIQNTFASEGAFELIATTTNGCVDTLGVIDITIEGCDPCNLSASDFNITCSQVIGDSIFYNYSITATIDNAASYSINPIVLVNGEAARIASIQPDSVAGSQNMLTGTFVIGNVTVGDSVCIQLTASNPGVNCTTEICTVIEALACDFTPDIAVNINPYSCEAQFSAAALFGACVNSDSVLYSWTVTQNTNTFTGTDSTLVLNDLETGEAQVCLQMQVFNSVDSSFCIKDTCITVNVPDCNCYDNCNTLSIRSTKFQRFIQRNDSCIVVFRVVLNNPQNVVVFPNHFQSTSGGQVLSISSANAGANRIAYRVEYYQNQPSQCGDACFELFLNNGGTDCCLKFCINLPTCSCELNLQELELDCSDPSLQNGQVGFSLKAFANSCENFDYGITDLTATVDGTPVNIVSFSPSTITNGSVFVNGVVDLVGQTGHEICIDVNAGIEGNTCLASVCAELPQVTCDLQVDFESIINPEACTITLINTSTSNPCISIDSTDIRWTIELQDRTVVLYGDTVKLSNISEELISVCMFISSTDITGNVVCEGEICKEVEVPPCECSNSCENIEVTAVDFDQFVDQGDSCIIRFFLTLQEPLANGFDLCAMLSDEGKVVNTSIVSSAGGSTTYAIDFYPNQSWLGGTACFSAFIGLSNGGNCCQEFCVLLPSCDCGLNLDGITIDCAAPNPGARIFDFKIPVTLTAGAGFSYGTQVTATLNGTPITVLNHSPLNLTSGIDTIVGQVQASQALAFDTVCFTVTSSLGGKSCTTTACVQIPDHTCEVFQAYSWTYDQSTCTFTVFDETTVDPCTYLSVSQYLIFQNNDTILVDTSARQYSFTNLSDTIIFCIGTDGIQFDGSTDCGDHLCDTIIFPPCNMPGTGTGGGGGGQSPLAREKKEQDQLNAITTYPNPTKNKLTVEWNKVLDENVQVVLLNQNGEVVLQDQKRIQGSKLELDLSNFSDGVYVLEITQAESVYREKVILLK